MEKREKESHVLLLPYPAQGHINPLLQFGKRLASRNLRVTLATTRFLANSTKPAPGPVSFESISDGFDSGGYKAAPNFRSYADRFEAVGSETLSYLILKLHSEGRPVHVLVYDPFMPWAVDVAGRFGLRTAAFFTQCCAVNTIYHHVWEGRLEAPAREPVQLPGLCRLEHRDYPTFVTGLDPDALALLKNQYKNLDKADVVLINSFYELESEGFDYMKLHLPVKSIGPTVPSKYLDGRIASDSHYVFNLHTPDTANYSGWLDTKPPASVVYVSFGSLAELSLEQTNEIASALITTNKSFLWIVRASELAKLPDGFVEDITAKRLGMVVTWCSQLDVLAHVAIGCFVTHCGWNSATEALGFGVPMVGVPHWSDQTTNAKYLEDVWRAGVRVKADEKGFVTGEEVGRCIKEVMDGGRSEEIRRNAAKWRELARDAVSEGGSSDKSIDEFIDEFSK